ncbi:hypothetical protein, partial [Staphylococcus aureus]
AVPFLFPAMPDILLSLFHLHSFFQILHYCHLFSIMAGGDMLPPPASLCQSKYVKPHCSTENIAFWIFFCQYELSK